MHFNFGGIVMFCNKCGQEISAGDRFCQHCGAPVVPVEDTPVQQPAAAEIATPVEPVIPTEPVTPVTPVTPDTPVEDPGASTGKTAFTLGLIGLIAGAICSCGCALLGSIAPLICSILAIVFGNKAKQQSAAAGFENSKAKTAVTLGIIGIAVVVIFVILNMVLGAIMGASGIYDSIYSSI